MGKELDEHVDFWSRPFDAGPTRSWPPTLS
jgi:hypothetical protein